MHTIDFDTLQSCAHSVGLALVAVLDRPDLSSEIPHLQRWQDAGYAGEMSYMLRPANLLAHPEQLLAGLRSVVVVGAFYDRAQREPLKAGFGRVARYAWGRDYHKVLRTRLRNLVAVVERQLGHSVAHRMFSDSVPLLERALAQASGLGFVGKNTMVITPRLGSFMFLGEVLWDLEIVGAPKHLQPGSHTVEPSAPHHGKSRCGACTQCLNGCPTGAFVSEYVLDARRCISYLTIEKRGTLSLQERRWLGEWIFGCDVCQEVCPFNAVSIKTRRKADFAEFEQSAGVGQSLALAELLALRRDDQFIARFAGTALTRAKREGLLRNAAIVAANTQSFALLPDLELTAREDLSPIVRQHALWSHWELSRMQGSDAQHRSQRLLESALSDPDPEVREEVKSCLHAP
jgi:epoxyqueuosine reductase